MGAARKRFGAEQMAKPIRAGLSVLLCLPVRPFKPIVYVQDRQTKRGEPTVRYG